MAELFRQVAGQTVSLAIVVNDNDGQGRGWMEWGSGLAESKRPALFPPLRLLAAPLDSLDKDNSSE